jgi:predicted O-methyltransferase YrrM
MLAFDVVAEALEGIPYMTRDQGWSIYQHIRDSGAHEVLEIGCGHGVSACYMAAAIDGPGQVTTVDHAAFTTTRNPHPRDVIRRAGLADRIELVLVEDSSYTWWLKDQVNRRSDHQGNCTPMYDFCYLDGAHNLTIDGLAVVLIEKLLEPGGWLLLDDLRWTYEASSGEEWFPGLHPQLSRAEITEPHMQAVFDLIVRQHPAFSETRVENGEWGWAHKDSAAPRRYEVVETGLPLSSLLRRGLKQMQQRAARRRPHGQQGPP